MADLDAALDRQHPLAVGRRIAGDDVAQVRHLVGFRQIAPPVHPRDVEILLVGTADEVTHLRHREVGDHPDGLPCSDRTEIARPAAEARADLRLGGEPESVLQSAQLAGLDLVQFVVAADQQQPDLQTGHLAAGIPAVDGEYDRLDRAFERHAEQFGDILATLLARRRHLAHRLLRRQPIGNQRHRLGHLDVGGVVGRRAVGDGVFARVRDDLEFVTGPSADVAGIGGDGAESQPHAGEDALVSLVHRAVARHAAGVVAIEGVSILHRELAAAHQAEARPPLVAELGLDVIEVDRQLLVALDLLAEDVGNHLLGGGLDDEVPLVAVLQARQFRPHLEPAPGLHPQFRRLHHRHQQLDGTRAVHLLADDVLDLADRAQPDRQVTVDAGGELLDHARPHHQPVTDHLCIGRRFSEGGNEEAGSAHRNMSPRTRTDSPVI